MIVALLGAAAYAAVQLDMMPNPFPRQPSAYPAPSDSRDGRWAQDLDYLVENIATLHRNAFWRVSRADFTARAAELRAQIPTLTDSEIMIGMARLLALIGDGYTRPYLLEDGRLRQFPLALRWLGNDLVVMGAAEAYRDAIGGRVVQMGDMGIADVYARVQPLVSIDNGQQLLGSSPRWLVSGEALAAVGVLEDAAQAQVVVEMVDGAMVTLDIVLPAEDEAAGLVTVYDVLGGETPLRRQNPNANYWYTYLESEETVYFHYFRCADDPEQVFADFNAEMFAFIDANPMQKIVIDLRFNSGGNSNVLRPFIEAIKARPHLNTEQVFSILIGRDTFSSALMNAIQLDEETNGRLIGEATGGKPNHYGETRTFALPNSQIMIQYSTRFFRQLWDSDPDALYPDWQIEMTWDDLLNGRDPALDTAIHGAA
jgi:hypothetical protein